MRPVRPQLVAQYEAEPTCPSLYRYPTLQKALIPEVKGFPGAGDMGTVIAVQRDLEKFVLDVIREHIGEIEASASAIRRDKR
jgi:hypothetical protein